MTTSYWNSAPKSTFALDFGFERSYRQKHSQLRHINMAATSYVTDAESLVHRRATELKNASNFFLKKQSSKLKGNLKQLGSTLEGAVSAAEETVVTNKHLGQKVLALFWDARYVLWVIIFYVINVFIWKAYHPDWSTMQSIYFITASLTTVGYGKYAAILRYYSS